MTKEELTKVERYAKKVMDKGSDPVHDWRHVDRVRKIALEIVKFLKIKRIDSNLLEACCLVHDIYYGNKQEKNLLQTYFSEARESIKVLEKARTNELEFIDYWDWRVILEAVKHHPLSFPFRILNKNRNIYCQILQDADTVDLFNQEKLVEALKKKKISWIHKNFKFVYDLGYNNLRFFLNKPAVADKFGRINDTTLDYDEYGVGNKKTIILVAGYAACKHSFLRLVEQLKNKFHIVVIELPMMSGFKKKLTVSELSFYIKRVVDELELEKFDLVGFSFGGLVAIYYAFKNQRRIGKVVLLSILPVLLKSDFFRFIYRYIKFITSSNCFAKIYAGLNTNSGIRKIFGSKKDDDCEVKLMRKYPVSIFTTLFYNLDVDLRKEFNKIKARKIVFMCKDDRVYKWRRFIKLRKYLRTDYILCQSGGHNLNDIYQENAAKIWA